MFMNKFQKKSQENVSTQTYLEKQDDPLQQQISLQNMFDAIKVKYRKIFFIMTNLFFFFRLLKFMNQLKI